MLFPAVFNSTILAWISLHSGLSPTTSTLRIALNAAVFVNKGKVFVS